MLGGGPEVGPRERRRRSLIGWFFIIRTKDPVALCLSPETLAHLHVLHPC